MAPFPPPFGGIARYVQDLMGSKLLKKSFDLYRVDTSRGESLIRGDGRGENTWGRWRLFLKPKNWAFLVYIVLNYFEFLGKLLITKPEVVHVHTCSYFGFIRSGGFLFLARIFPCRRIFHLHNAIDLFYDDHGAHPFWGRAIRWSLHQASEYVVLSEGLREWVKENLQKDATVIWNACYSEKYRSKNRKKLDEQYPEAIDRIVVLMLGGLHEYKGAFDLLHVIASLTTEQRNNLIFLIPGRGDIERAQSFVNIHALDDCVVLPGMVPEEQKDDMLRGADIFVLPSYSEGQPIAILEAMSASLPVIATNIGSISEVVDDEHMGYLVDPGDCNELKNVLLILISDKQLREQMGVKARIRVDSRHDINRLFEAIADLYNNVEK